MLFFLGYEPNSVLFKYLTTAMFGFVFTHGYLSTLMLVFYECECTCLSYLPCLL